MPGTSPGMTNTAAWRIDLSTPPCSCVACFLGSGGRYNGREVGGGRATRQPGQVRKEAALTSAVRVARQPPTPSCERQRPASAAYGNPLMSDAADHAQSQFASRNPSANDGSYRVLARKYRPATF